MHPNEELINKFYSSFQKKDYKSMIGCYHKDVEFSDPIFNLKGWQAKAMWKMLVEKAASDFSLTYSVGKADDLKGSAHWEPIYSFSKSGRIIHNIIDAEFDFKDGKIIKHCDRFSLWRWTRMALGTTGIFLGWTPKIQNKVKSEANSGLEMFIKRNRLKEDSFN